MKIILPFLAWAAWCFLAIQSWSISATLSFPSDTKKHTDTIGLIFYSLPIVFFWIHLGKFDGFILRTSLYVGLFLTSQYFYALRDVATGNPKIGIILMQILILAVMSVAAVRRRINDQKNQSSGNLPEAPPRG